MIETMPGLTYGQLAGSLKEHGFEELVTEAGRTFLHESGARLLLPPLSDQEPLRAYHYVAARALLDDYGISPRDAFDLSLTRKMFSQNPAPAPVAE
jgi:hypothetical protein